MATTATPQIIAIGLISAATLLTGCSTTPGTHRTHTSWKSIEPGMSQHAFRDAFERQPGRIGEDPVATNIIALCGGGNYRVHL